MKPNKIRHLLRVETAWCEILARRIFNRFGLVMSEGDFVVLAQEFMQRVYLEPNWKMAAPIKWADVWMERYLAAKKVPNQ